MYKTHIRTGHITANETKQKNITVQFFIFLPLYPSLNSQYIPSADSKTVFTYNQTYYAYDVWLGNYFAYKTNKSWG